MNLSDEATAAVVNLAALVLGLFLEIAGIPLWFRLVPPNRCFGFWCTSKTRANSRNWYEFNELAGKLMTISGFILSILAIVYWVLPAFDFHIPIRIGIICILFFIELVVSIALLVRMNRNLDDTNVQSYFDQL